jgi:hypothetical protein
MTSPEDMLDLAKMVRHPTSAVDDCSRRVRDRTRGVTGLQAPRKI